MRHDTWEPFAEGSSIGTSGSECGSIIKDDEHALGARITLEQKTQTAPFAITCGIYGWMIHTRFFATAEEASEEFESMKISLTEILSHWPTQGESTTEFVEDISNFIARYP